MPATSPVCGVFSGIPSFFRACCHEVRHRHLNTSYEHPARELTQHLEGQVPLGIEEDEWFAELGQLRTLIGASDDEGVWRWFHDHYPKCMALIPARRRDAFLRGVYEAASNEDLPW